MKRSVVVLLLVAAACGSAPSSPRAQARELESRVWSPYCPGRLLADCTTAQAAELREEIERRLDRGQTQAQVLSWIRDNFGDEALAAPPRGGRGLAVWLVPLAAVLGGAVIVGGVVRRSLRGPTPAPAARAPLPPPTPQEQERLIARVREEVERDP